MSSPGEWSAHLRNFKIDAFDEQTGTPVSTYTDSDPYTEGIQLAFDGSRLFADGTANGLMAFDATTGHVLWSRDDANSIGNVGPLVATHGVVYYTVSDRGAQEYAIDETSGATRWVTPEMMSSTGGGPVIGDGRLFLIGSDVPNGHGNSYPDGYALDLATGALIRRDTIGSGSGDDGCSWTATFSGGELWSSECGYNESDLPYGDRLDPATGASLGHYVDSGLNSIVLDGNQEMGLPENDSCVAQPSFNCTFKSATVTSQDVSGGSILWSFTGDGQLDSGLVRVNHDVYVGPATGRLYAVDDQTGSPVWSMVMPDSFQPEHLNTMPSGMAADGNILAVVAGNSLTILTPAATGASPTDPTPAVGGTADSGPEATAPALPAGGSQTSAGGGTQRSAVGPSTTRGSARVAH